MRRQWWGPLFFKPGYIKRMQFNWLSYAPTQLSVCVHILIALISHEEASLSTIINSIHKFIKFLIAKVNLIVEHRAEFQLDFLLLLLYHVWVSLGAHQSASYANKLIISIACMSPSISSSQFSFSCYTFIAWFVHKVSSTQFFLITYESTTVWNSKLYLNLW